MNIAFIILGVRSLSNASRARKCNPLNPPGVGWVNFFGREPVSSLSAHACQIWARSDGRVEKSVS